jgi:hypothetical protein
MVTEPASHTAAHAPQEAGVSVAKKTTVAPALKVETWPLGRVTGYHRNACEHSSAQIDQIGESIRTFGWTTPLLVTPAGALIAGTGAWRPPSGSG